MVLSMRDHRKLKAFQLADELAIAIYKATQTFPKHEVYGLAQQLRRAAVSCASNIVEGCGRYSEADFLRFLDMAYGSACEVQYQVFLARRLDYLAGDAGEELESRCREVARVLNALIRSIRRAAPPAG